MEFSLRENAVRFQNSILWVLNVSAVTEERSRSSTMESVMPYGAEPWIMNKDVHRKLLPTDTDSWRCVGRRFECKFLDDVIREEVEMERSSES
jgi:hypothetical protein